MTETGMRRPDTHITLVRRIIFLTVLIFISAVLISVTIYTEERLPDPLLDRSINFHSVVMHDTNRLIMHIDTVTLDINYDSETNTGLQIIANVDSSLKEFLTRIDSLYLKYGFSPGQKILEKIRKDSGELSLFISGSSGTYPGDLNVMRDRINTVTNNLQQLYRLHESDDNSIREQLVQYQKQRPLIIIPLIAVILALTALLSYMLIRSILRSLAVQHTLEQELRETAVSHQQILNSMYVFVGLLTVDGRLVEMNEAPLKATGLRRDDVQGVEIWETYALAYSQESKNTIKSLVSRAATGEVVRQDVKVRIAGGNFIFMDGIFSPVYDSAGRIVNVIGSGVDITARKNIEEEMRANAQRQDFLLSSSPAVIYTCKPYGNFAATYISPNFHEEFGYSMEEFLHDPAFWTKNVHPEDLARVIKGFAALIAQETLSHQYRFRLPDGSYHWVQDDLRLIRNSDGTPREIIGSWRDIHTTKYTEEVQRQNEERLKEAQRIANLGNWELNLVTNLLMWSDEVYRIFEIDKEKFHASYESFLNLVHPEDREHVKTAYENSLKTRSPYEITHRLLMPDGRIKWITERCHTFFDETGSALRSVGTVQDITLQYNTRLELQTGRAITDELFANLQGMVYRCQNDRDWTLEFVTEGITPLTGYTPREFVEDRSVHFGQLILPEDAERVWVTVQEGIKYHTAYEISYRIRTRNGDIKWVAERGHGVFTDEGQLLYLQGLIIDDTQRQQAEHDLKLAHTAIDKSKSAFFWINLDGKVIYVNDYACQNLGYTREELTGMYIWDFDPDFTRADLPPTIERMKLKGVVVLESRHRRKDGTIFPIEVTANYITFGNESHIFTFVQDISERRQKDVELEQSRTLLSAVVENLPNMVFLKNAHDLKITLLNKAGEELLGIPREQCIGRNDYDLFPRDQAVFFNARDQETLRNKTVVDIPEEPITTANKGIRLLHTRKVGIYDADQTPRYLLGISEDITDKKQAEDALRTSEERLRLVIKGSNDGIWDWNILTGENYRSTRWKEILGYRDDELSASTSTFFQYLHPEDIPLVNEGLRRHLEVKAPYALEIRMKHKDGNYRWMLTRGEAVRDGAGKPVRMVGSLTDITERKKAEKTILESEQRLRGLLEFSPIAVRIARAGREVVFCNQSYAALVKVERNKVIGIDPRSYYAHPEEYDRILGDLSQGATIRNQLVELNIPGERSIWALASYELIRYEGENAIIGWFYDITALKNAEQALRASEEALRRLNETLELRVTERARELHAERNFIHSVLETAGALVFVFDRKGRIVRFNRACETLTGYRFEEIKDRPFWEVLIPPEQAAAMQSLLDNLSRFTQSSRGEGEWLTRAGERRLIEWSYTLMHGEDGQEIAYIIGTGIDITDRKMVEESLRTAKEQAEQASHAKSQFLSRMSHELRTPMNAILGFTQLLEMDVQEPGQQDSVREILRASHHLLDLINELLDLSRIEAGYLHVTLEPLNPATLISEAVNLVWPLVEKKKLTLHNQTAPARGLPVLADSTRLRQVLVNLLSNAAKYNKPGGSIRVDCTPLDEGRLRLSITDTGPGIAPDKQSLLFQPFERLGAEATQVEGAGIGLALSKRLVELMGGEIGMNSIVGKGSTFWLDLPRALRQATTPSPSSQGPIFTEEVRSKVLYVEDNAANLRLIERVLSRYPSLHMISAIDGETGLELAKAHHPDVILLDIQLPGIDGFEVLQRLRQDPLTAAIPVVAVSADAMPPDIERALQAGFHHYLTKPINIEDLIEVITSILPHSDLRGATRH